MAKYFNGTLSIKSEDIERVVAAQPENISNARGYFKQVKLKNSTHIASAELKREYGNVPVIVRGDTGVTPKHGADVTDIVPMPIEIDDKISAVDIDELGRATDLGTNQIVDSYLEQHADMVRNTINALCCQAHKGSIDYMMKSGSGFERYQVNYGTVKNVTFSEKVSQLTLGLAVQKLSAIRKLTVDQGVGGPGEFIEDGVSGMLAAPGDIDTMADKICTLIEQPELRRRMGVDINKQAGDFTPDRILSHWDALFRRLTAAE